MTDAELWRMIAKNFEDEDPNYWDGLCNAVDILADMSGQWDRMAKAQQLFRPPRVGRGFWWGQPNAREYHPDARILAACFLAAMAEADGGNHAA